MLHNWKEKKWCINDHDYDKSMKHHILDQSWAVFPKLWKFFLRRNMPYFCAPTCPSSILRTNRQVEKITNLFREKFFSFSIWSSQYRSSLPPLVSFCIHARIISSSSRLSFSPTCRSLLITILSLDTWKTFNWRLFKSAN